MGARLSATSQFEYNLKQTKLLSKEWVATIHKKDEDLVTIEQQIEAFSYFGIVGFCTQESRRKEILANKECMAP